MDMRFDLSITLIGIDIDIAQCALKGGVSAGISGGGALEHTHLTMKNESV